jgi:hypothetical protein
MVRQRGQPVGDRMPVGGEHGGHDLGQPAVHVTNESTYARILTRGNRPTSSGIEPEHRQSPRQRLELVGRAVRDEAAALGEPDADRHLDRECP